MHNVKHLLRWAFLQHLCYLSVKQDRTGMITTTSNSYLGYTSYEHLLRNYKFGNNLLDPTVCGTYQRSITSKLVMSSNRHSFSNFDAVLDRLIIKSFGYDCVATSKRPERLHWWEIISEISSKRCILPYTVVLERIYAISIVHDLL